MELFSLSECIEKGLVKVGWMGRGGTVGEGKETARQLLLTGFIRGHIAPVSLLGFQLLQ